MTSITVVVDSEWAHPDHEQTVLVDNTNVDGAIYTYDKSEPTGKDDCKNGGWMDLVNGDGEPFKNQGDCVSYTNNGK